MGNAKERLKILENVIARVGLDGDVLGEFAKAMSTLNGLDSFNELNPPTPPQNQPPVQQQPQEPMINNEGMGGGVLPPEKPI